MWKKSTKSGFIPANKKYSQAVLSTSSKHLNTMKKRCYSICVILWVLITTLSATSPTTFHIALKKIYPHATNVSWSQQGNYYVASFIQNGFEKEVWMNGNAQWVMTNTDLQTTDQLTPNVYNDFTLSPYAMWTATNVNLIEFPKRTTLYVITVNLNNSSAISQCIETKGK